MTEQRMPTEHDLTDAAIVRVTAERWIVPVKAEVGDCLRVGDRLWGVTESMHATSQSAVRVRRITPEERRAQLEAIAAATEARDATLRIAKEIQKSTGADPQSLYRSLGEVLDAGVRAIKAGRKAERAKRRGEQS